MIKYLLDWLKKVSKRIQPLIKKSGDLESSHSQNKSHTTDQKIGNSIQRKILKKTETNTSNNYLGRSFIIKGDLIGNEDLTIDGMVEGSIEIGNYSLTIGSKARVQANIQARNVNISGNVTGNIYAKDKVELKSVSSLVGNVRSRRILIEDSARFKGSIEMEKVNKPNKSQETSVESNKLKNRS